MTQPTLKIRTENDHRINFDYHSQTLHDTDHCHSFDFEYHKYDCGKITLFREFHLNSSNPLISALDKAILDLCLQYCIFELCYEDGIPCLSLTIENPKPEQFTDYLPLT